ncbi:MAG: hypothetical protein OEZ15_08105 [Gammaproteobacteria bacterium]|nr:hypothetical protein [Gammaproteobacteria bacterium]
MSKFLVIVALLFPVAAFCGVPGQVNFQGVLLNSASQAVNGSVNFNFTLFDAATGGAQLWSESQVGVPVTDGMYSVALGSVTPLSTGILSGGAVYLEVSVGGEILSPRQRLLAVPYALNAEEANNVAGISGAFIQQLFQHADFDGQSLPNNDPLEGVIDTDGDGLANFIDPDNDNDGFTDDQELANGTGVNLVTPVIYTTTSGSAGVPLPVAVTGNNFLAGLTVQVGTENPVPQNLTTTGFDITVGAAQAPGSTAITVTNPNAEVATGAITFHGKLAFVTSSSINGAGLLSVAEADAFCAAAATAAGLPGSFVAWYSDPVNSINAKDRLPANGGPWERLDGVVVATSLADLTDGSIAATISIDENGVNKGSAMVATRTLATGLADANNCLNPAGSGITGVTTSTTGWSWMSGSYLGCTNPNPIYCFEQ